MQLASELPASFRPNAAHIRPTRNDAARNSLRAVPTDVRRIAELVIAQQPLTAAESQRWNSFQLSGF